jgi:hypothetical protein
MWASVVARARVAADVVFRNASGLNHNSPALSEQQQVTILYQASQPPAPKLSRQVPPLSPHRGRYLVAADSDGTRSNSLADIPPNLCCFQRRDKRGVRAWRGGGLGSGLGMWSRCALKKSLGKRSWACTDLSLAPLPTGQDAVLSLGVPDCERPPGHDNWLASWN